MKNNSFIQQLRNWLVNVIGTIGAFGGSYSLIKDITDPTLPLTDMLSSKAAVILYILISIVSFIVLLLHEFRKNKNIIEDDKKRIKRLTEELERIERERNNDKTGEFKSFWLSTEKLYFEIADKIKNKISITELDICNTIEETGNGNKRDSIVKLSIRGVVQEDVSNIQILSAGDSKAKWDEIQMEAYEVIHDKKTRLECKLADGGKDTILKQVVITYGEVKKKGDILDLVISWKWPNMLSITGEDYITLPVIFSSETKQASMSLEPKENLKFDEIGIYKYSVGTQSPTFIKAINVNEEKIYYKDDSPEYKSCYILYYKIANAE